jgi:hypothetical protein
VKAVETLLPFVYESAMEGETPYEIAVIALENAWKKAKGG